MEIVGEIKIKIEELSDSEAEDGTTSLVVNLDDVPSDFSGSSYHSAKEEHLEDPALALRDNLFSWATRVHPAPIQNIDHSVKKRKIQTKFPISKATNSNKMILNDIN